MTRAGLLLVLAGSVAPAPLLAQAAAPPVVQQGLPSREEVRPPQLQQPIAPPSRLTVEGGIERAPCPLADPRFANVSVTLTQVAFNNLAPVDPALVAPAFEGFLGRPLPIAAVCEIRDRAATILRGAGYLAAVQVPPQKIDAGVLTLDVLFARMTRVRIRGQTGRAERLLAGTLEQLQSDRPFNQKEAERALLLARDLPGFDVRLTLRPAGTAPGEVIGDVVVTRLPAVIDVAVQNYGSPQVGRWTGLLRGEAYDLLGLGDRLSLGVLQTPELREQTAFQAGYDLRLGANGLSLATNLTYAWNRPDLGGGDPLRARTLVASAELAYPLVRRQALTVRAAGGFDLIEQRLRFAGVPLTRDKLRVFYLRGELVATDPASLASTRGWSAAEPRWRASGSLEFRHGVDILGASDGCGAAPLFLACQGGTGRSRVDGDPTAGLIRGAATFELRPVPRVALVTSVRGQVSLDPLLAYEEFSGGNYTIGRGYDPGVISADDGVGVSVEARFGKLSPSGPEDLALQPYLFVDAAEVWNRGALRLAVEKEHLVSAGGGVRAAWGDRARIDVTLAAPLERTALQRDRDVRLLVSLTSRFFPWSPL